MARHRFVNRERELKVLDRTLEGSSPSLFVLYGRRRVGKTALLRKACEGRRHVFFTADLGSRRDQLESFSSALAEGLLEAEWSDAIFRGWEEALRVCIRRAQDEPLVLVLDEFQYLVMADRSLPSVVQRLLENEMSGGRLSLVLCGSQVSFMERRILGVRNPLFGRRAGQISLTPLSFRDAGRFFPTWSAERRMWATSVVGGVPAYLRHFKPNLTLTENIRRSILELGAPLFDEPRFLMMEELREPQVHFSICRAMAHGHGRPNEISQAAGLAGKGNIASYLNTLRELRLVERRVPVTVRNPERSRLGLYRLSGPFLRFWFRFVLPNRTALEAGDEKLVWKRKIDPHLAQHTSAAFEDACREHLQQLNRGGKLPAVYDRIGPWWRGGNEVDLAAIGDDGPLLLAECKWSRKPLGVDILAHLIAKLPTVAADLERPATTVDYALFSRAGFTKDLAKEARSKGVLLFNIKDVLG
jgi:AAA+ ATPase superfamily predicted ATPase